MPPDGGVALSRLWGDPAAGHPSGRGAAIAGGMVVPPHPRAPGLPSVPTPSCGHKADSFHSWARTGHQKFGSPPPPGPDTAPGRKRPCFPPLGAGGEVLEAAGPAQPRTPAWQAGRQPAGPPWPGCPARPSRGAPASCPRDLQQPQGTAPAQEPAPGCTAPMPQTQPVPRLHFETLLLGRRPSCVKCQTTSLT